MMRNKKSFTLLEIFICVALLGMLSGLLGWQIKNMIDSHKFRFAVDHFFGRIQELKTIAQSYRIDIEIELFKEGDLFYYKISSEESLSFLDQGKKFFLNEVNSLMSNGKKVEKCNMTLFSNGRIYSPNLLGFKSKKESYSLNIDFTSYPQIKLVEKKENEESS